MRQPSKYGSSGKNLVENLNESGTAEFKGPSNTMIEAISTLWRAFHY